MTRKKVQQQFSPRATQYARAAYFDMNPALAEMIEVMQPKPAWRVLDVATGGGHTAFAFAPKVQGVIATDVSPAMLHAAAAVAHERGLRNISFEAADAEALPYDDATFDAVTCRIAAHHFSDAGEGVRQMARVVKAGGVVGLIDPVVPYERAVADEINAWETLRDPSHVACLTINGWASLFCAANLDAVHINTFDVDVDFDDLMSRAGRDAKTTADLRRHLLHGSAGMREYFKPREQEGRLTFTWPQALIVGRKGVACRIA
jgi:ubiquinone/menaquinone biosynthesis C-methylase UbiE